MRHVLFALSLTISNAALATLPPEVEAAKAELIALSQANINSWGDLGVQAQLDPHVEVLADYFAANRPANEADLTLGAWRAIWYEDGSLAGGFGGIIVPDVNNSYQVVRDGFYYNVSNSVVDLGFTSFAVSGFLKGTYVIGNTPDTTNAGERGLNVIELEFVSNAIRLRTLPTWIPLTRVVDLIDRGFFPGITVPGPIGVTGDLYNLYVDDDLRVAFGANDTGSDMGNGLYVLIRQDYATN